MGGSIGSDSSRRHHTVRNVRLSNFNDSDFIARKTEAMDKLKQRAAPPKQKGPGTAVGRISSMRAERERERALSSAAPSSLPSGSSDYSPTPESQSDQSDAENDVRLGIEPTMSCAERENTTDSPDQCVVIRKSSSEQCVVIGNPQT